MFPEYSGENKIEHVQNNHESFPLQSHKKGYMANFSSGIRLAV